MKSTNFNHTSILSMVAAVVVFASGCGQQATESSGDLTPVTEASREDASHGGWWCAEHGVPEKECSLCSSKAADEFKTKGDWCEEHNRAESQCFICSPSRAEKFAKLYFAKVGKNPPKLEESKEEEN